MSSSDTGSERPHLDPSDLKPEGGSKSGGASGLATPLQPGGLTPAGGPGASVGSLGTGGAQTANEDSGAVKRGGE